MPDPISPPAPDQLESRLRAALAPNLLLVREIGAGGMARVFLAREPALKRLVAVKVLSGELANTDAGRVRFEREAQAVAGLSHPNVVAVHTVGELDDGTSYFIMQYVEGLSLSERIAREGTLAIAEARRALGEVAAALAAAHAQGIIHRDVKPANILYEEATGRSLVSDFGIAAMGRETAAPVNVKLTATGSILGTPQYMSPEQLLAEPVTEKTDVYSLGLLAHEMLCGSAPFKGGSPHELIAAHLRDVPARLSVRRPDVDAELDAVVASCLEKNASLRPTAADVARRLTPGAGALLEWPPPGMEDLHGSLRRISGFSMLGGASVTLIMLGIVATGPNLNSALTSPATLMLLVAAIAAIVPLSGALWRAVRSGIRAARAIRNGYAWMTVLETMADFRGDTGNLISASREYAGLKPAERDAFRLGRLRREVALLIGGLAALPLLLVTVFLGSLGAAGWQSTWLALLAPAAGFAYAFAIDLKEQRTFAPRRKRRVAATVDVSRLTGPWYETFEDVRQGQRIGRGPAQGANVGRWGAIAAAAVMLIVILLFLPLVIVGTLGPSYWGIVLPQFARTTEKVLIANLARGYRLPADSSVTPLAAGEAFHALHGKGRAHPSFPEQTPLPLPPPPWADTIPADVFPNARWTNAPGIPSSIKIIPMVRAGVSAKELAFLARIAAAPQWKHFDLLARAPSLDYMGARFILPFPEGANVFHQPIPPFGITKALAYANVSRAAYHLARGRRDSAEGTLRAGVSVGFLMADEGNTIIEQLIGVVVVGISRQGLVDYYKALGDPRGPALQAQVDSLAAQFESNLRGDMPPLFPNVDPKNVAALRAAIIRTAENRRELRGVRLEMTGLLAMTPCTNMRELVFGMSPNIRDIIKRQRAQLTRFPSDSAYFDIVEHLAEVTPRSDSHWTALSRATRIVGAVLRNERLPGCVSVLSTFTG